MCTWFSIRTVLSPFWNVYVVFYTYRSFPILKCLRGFLYVPFSLVFETYTWFSIRTVLSPFWNVYVVFYTHRSFSILKCLLVFFYVPFFPHFKMFPCFFIRTVLSPFWNVYVVFYTYRSFPFTWFSIRTVLFLRLVMTKQYLFKVWFTIQYYNGHETKRSLYTSKLKLEPKLRNAFYVFKIVNTKLSVDVMAITCCRFNISRVFLQRVQATHAQVVTLQSTIVPYVK